MHFVHIAQFVFAREEAIVTFLKEQGFHPNAPLSYNVVVQKCIVYDVLRL